MDALKKDVQTAKEQLEARSELVTELESDLKEARQEAARLSSRLDEDNAQHAATANKATTLGDRVRQLEERIAQQQEHAQRLEAEYARAQEQHRQQLKVSVDNKKSLLSRIETLELQLAQAQTAGNAADSSLLALRADVAAAQAAADEEVLVLTQALGRLQEEAAALLTSTVAGKADASDKVAELEQQLAQLQSDHQAQAAELDLLGAEAAAVDALQSRVAALDEERWDQAAELETLRKQAVDHEVVEQRITALEAELATRTQRLATLGAEKTALEEMLAAANAQLEQQAPAEQAPTEYEGESSIDDAAAAHTLDALTVERDQLCTERDGLRADLTAAEEEILRLINAVREAESKAAAMEQADVPAGAEARSSAPAEGEPDEVGDLAAQKP